MFCAKILKLPVFPYQILFNKIILTKFEEVSMCSCEGIKIFVYISLIFLIFRIAIIYNKC